MKRVVFSLAMLLSLMAAPAMAAVQFSTSGTDANQGNSLSLQVGQTGSMFVWISTDQGQTVAGIGMDILSSDANVLEGTAYNIANPNNRWLAPNAGTVGDLVTGSNAFALPGISGTGLGTNGQADFQLFSEIQFNATAAGATNLSLQINGNGFGDSTGADLAGTVAGVAGNVSVSAVPEPSSMALLAMAAGGACLRRRRRA